MKIYVATKWEQLERAREVMTRLTDEGHTITYDWTRSEQLSKEQAQLDVEGVRAAQALVVLAEYDLPYKGTYVEFGIAVERNTPVFIVGPAFEDCIFTRLPRVYQVATVNHLIPFLEYHEAWRQ